MAGLNFLILTKSEAATSVRMKTSHSSSGFTQIRSPLRFREPGAASSALNILLLNIEIKPARIASSVFAGTSRNNWKKIIWNHINLLAFDYKLTSFKRCHREFSFQYMKDSWNPCPPETGLCYVTKIHNVKLWRIKIALVCVKFTNHFYNSGRFKMTNSQSRNMWFFILKTSTNSHTNLKLLKYFIAGIYIYSSTEQGAEMRKTLTGSIH